MKSLENKLIYKIKRDSITYKFQYRVFAKIGWILFLSISATLFIYIKHGGEYIGLPISFLSIFLLYDFLSTWHSEKYLLTYLEIDAENENIHIKINLYNTEFINEKYELRHCEIALRKLLLGQILQPNYQLVIKHKGQILIKQKGNSLWPRLYLKEIKEETKDFVK
jgi:hypothetical protein